MRRLACVPAGFYAWCVASVFFAVWPGRTSASGFAISAQSGSESGAAFAGQAAAEDASTIWYNPAGMLALDGSTIAIVGNAIRTSFDFENTASTGAFGVPASNGGDGGSLAVVPQLYGVADLGDRWRVGIAANPPFGLKTQYQPGWRGQLVALKSEVESYNINPAVAYRLSDYLWVGTGLSWQRFTADLTNDAGPAGTAELNAGDSSWGFNVGSMIILPDDARIGIAYRSKIAYKLRGTASFSAGDGALNSAAKVDLTTPESVSLSVVSPIATHWSFMADATWTRWSRLQQLTVLRTTASTLGPAGSTVTVLPFDWRNALFVSLGASYEIRDDWKMRLGIAHDAGVSSEQTRTPRLPDQSRILVTVGSTYRLSGRDSIDVGYGHEFVADAMVQDAVVGVPGVLAGRFKDAADVLSVEYNRKL